jgi:hypothetical protein
VLLRTSCFNRGLAFMEIALCMDIWVEQRFWVTSQVWKGSGKCPRVQWFRHKCIPSI